MKNDLSKIPDHILRAAFNPRRFAEGGPTFGGNDEDDDLDSYFGDLGSTSSTPTNDSGEGGDVGSKPTETKTDTSTSSLGTKTTSAPDPKAVNASPVSTSSSVSFGDAVRAHSRIADTPEDRLNSTENSYRAANGSYAGPKGISSLNTDARMAAADMLGYKAPDVTRVPGDAAAMGRMMSAESSVIKNAFGQPNTAAMQGVGDVIRNRMASDRFPGQETVFDVIGARKQFSPIADGRYDNTPEDYSNTAVAESILNGETPSVVGNSLNYGNLDTINNKAGYSSAASKRGFNTMNGEYHFADATMPNTFQHTFGTQGGNSDVTFDGTMTPKGLPTGPSEIPKPVSNPSAKEILEQLAAQNAPQGVNSLVSPPKPTPRPEPSVADKYFSGSPLDAPISASEDVLTWPSNKIQDRIPAEEEERILEIENVPVEQSADGTNFSPESTLRKTEYAARNPAEYGMPGIPGADLATLPGMVRGISELASEIPSFDVNQLKAPAKQKIGLDLARVFGKDDDLITKYGGKALTGTIKSGLDYLNGLKNDFAESFTSSSPSQDDAVPDATPEAAPEDEVSTDEAWPSNAPYGITGQSVLRAPHRTALGVDLGPSWNDDIYPTTPDGKPVTADTVDPRDVYKSWAARNEGVEDYTEATTPEEKKRERKNAVLGGLDYGARLATHGASRALPGMRESVEAYDKLPSYTQAQRRAAVQAAHPDFYNPDTRGTDSYIPDPDSPYFPIWLEEQQNAIWGRKWG